MNRDEILAVINNSKRYDKHWGKRNPIAFTHILNHTEFLSEEVTLHERVYCYTNCITEVSKCGSCDNKVNYFRGKGYTEFCSNSCMGKSDKIQEQKRETCNKNYGVDIPFRSEVIRDKAKVTNLKRYGVENPFQNESIKDKIKQTHLDTIGVEYPMQSSDVREKSRLAIQEKYGVDNVQQNQDIKNKAIQTNLERYGVRSKKQEHIPLDILKLIDSPEWLYERHITDKVCVTTMAEIVGISKTTMLNYFHKHQIPITKHGFSQAEKEIITFLKEHYTGTILENDRQIIKPLELDIVLPDLKIAIEYCGLYWHSHIYKDKNYHLNKLNECNAAGYRLITIFEDEWVHQKDIYKGKLLNILHLQKTTRVFARKTSVVTVSNKDKKAFFNAYHIQGTGGGSVTYGLTHEGTLTSVMTFKYHKNSDSYELSRFASSGNVVGGFSKLVKHFRKEYPDKEIFSFADRRWSEGEVYLNNGFIIDKFNPPDYKYVVGDIRKHKYNFRHNKLEAKLIDYDPLLTEWENTENHGLYRIYDCGLIRFILK